LSDTKVSNKKHSLDKYNTLEELREATKSIL